MENFESISKEIDNIKSKSNANFNGKNFEDKTSLEEYLLKCNYKKIFLSKKNYFLYKTIENICIVFTSQSNFKSYIQHKYNIKIFRNPDEAFIIENSVGEKFIKILEKKCQNVNGSVETKLWSGSSLKREYQLVLGKDFDIQYIFCVNNFLKEKFLSINIPKYIILNKILEENNIKVLFGEDKNYFDTLISNFL